MCTSENRYCHESIYSLTIVESCPTTKAGWDAAARKKNCIKIASTQKCSSVDKFVYHCTVNGYKNVTLEVCAPFKLIIGNYNFIYDKNPFFTCLFFISTFFIIFDMIVYFYFFATLGSCVEFNVGGGVIQGQRLPKCNANFPKCDHVYYSFEAYKCNAIYKKNIIMVFMYI